MFLENKGSLRENDQNVSDYTIPHGDWFEYVSSPHYLAEIVSLLFSFLKIDGQLLLFLFFFLLQTIIFETLIFPEGIDLLGFLFTVFPFAVEVMYGGLVIASGFSDITIWLLFGFVVCL